MSAALWNWAHTDSCRPARLHRPRTAAEVAGLVRDAAGRGARVKAFGSGHSPGDIAMSEGAEVVRLEGMARVREVDREQRRVRVEGGATLAALVAALDAQGLALPSLGSITAQTIAGAVATATHGTGLGHGCSSTWIRELELVDGRGQLRRLSPTSRPDLFAAACCGLGVLGVVTELTLEVTPAFDLVVAERAASLDEVLDGLPGRLQADHYRFLYLPHADQVWEWSATRQAPGAPARRRGSWYRERLLGYHAFQSLLWLSTWLPALLPAVNRWYAARFFSGRRASRAPSASQFTFDCLFRQYTTEWCVPVARTAEALGELRRLAARPGLAVHLPVEVRFVAKDGVWLSPGQGRDGCYIGIVAYRPFGREPGHQPFFAAFEELMAGLEGRPHWAKRFRLGPQELRGRYAHWDDFQRARAELDPAEVFANAYSERVLGPRPAAEPARRVP